MIYGYAIYKLFFIFMFWGITGWLIEVADMKIEAGEFQNRGFLHLPICPLYGIGMLLMCILFRNGASSYVELFVFGILVGSITEYFVGWLLEKLFHTRWWDYSHMRYQIRGRVCMRNAILFGFGAIFTIGFVQPQVHSMIDQIPASAGMLCSSLLAMILMVDIAISVERAYQYKQKNGQGNIFVVFKSHR